MSYNGNNDSNGDPWEGGNSSDFKDPFDTAPDSSNGTDTDWGNGNDGAGWEDNNGSGQADGHDDWKGMTTSSCFLFQITLRQWEYTRRHASTCVSVVYVADKMIMMIHQ